MGLDGGTIGSAAVDADGGDAGFLCSGELNEAASREFRAWGGLRGMGEG
jgi:hypothetical protein